MQFKAISANSWITEIEDFTIVIITSRTYSGRTAFITHSTSPLLTELCHGTIFVFFLALVARNSGIRFIVSCDSDLIFCGSRRYLLVLLFLRILLSISSSARNTELLVQELNAISCTVTGLAGYRQHCPMLASNTQEIDTNNILQKKLISPSVLC